MDQAASPLSARLTAAVERMPAFPRSVQQILELTRDINCPPKKLVEVIETDPVIAIKILRIVNSAYFSLPSKITSINQSVVYLGLNTLKNLALNFSTIGMLPQHNAAGFDTRRYLLHALLTAGMTRTLVEQYAVGEADPTDAYTVGLLHNFGKIVFAQFMPEEFRQALAMSAAEGIPLHHAESAAIGADHAYVGAMLARHWQFAPLLVECIAGHHQGSGNGALAECLHCADLIAEDLCAEAFGDPPREDDGEAGGDGPGIAPRFGDDLQAIADGLGDLEDMVRKARLFCNAESMQ